MTLTITTADTHSQLGAVHRLTYDAYLAEGLCQASPDGRLLHYPHLDDIAETTVLVATVGPRLVGTVSITVDGPAGLHVDDDFPNVMRRVRAPGRRLAAAWRIVTDPTYRRDQRLITRLMRAGFEELIARRADLLVCSFHPRRQKVHWGLGFTTVSLGNCRALNGAPAVLMLYDLRRLGIPERLRREVKPLITANER